MDFLNKAKQMAGGTGNNTAATNNNAAGGAANNTNTDYGDKGLDFVEKKTGHTMGRDTNEKITDGARGLYEKATGSKVNPKYSN
ncbi:hypothetical protein BP5796_06167 [Coleophoma crateriformis]|uniref:Uncharacterized protein n=1 Tax=Coleophoma crateriformis TaxID=565419 RepID=A0A3D8RWC1_9HELO|nr:hypothetical protein BP5796_06167 [Coleophoma crateriformis]